jgi:hypothetical protein
MPIFLPRIIACVQNLDTCDFDEEHGSAEDVASVVGREADASLEFNGLETSDGVTGWPDGL